MKTRKLQTEILNFLREQPASSSKEIHEGLEMTVSYATVKRQLARLNDEQYIKSEGRGKSTIYFIAPAFELLQPIEVDKYFTKEIDERSIKESFNFALLSILADSRLFTQEEESYLTKLQGVFEKNIAELTPQEYNKEMERLAIDLSWKSSQIEGNTYSLLETERLILDKETAAGKPQADATMLLNHKEAINFIVDHPDYVNPLTVQGVEDIHSILVKDLGVDRNIRQRRVGISGTNYRPLDNEHQIKEALKEMCDLINNKDSVFEKALLCLILISYIQPFADGNKRTARIISNAVLVAYNYCPISFRTVDSIEYKKAMLIFYEQNNISVFKTIFIQQFAFAVKTYF